MQGHKDVIDALNQVLARELTAINQYFLHARMFQNWGLAHLGQLEYKASIDEMKHADELIQRILFLEGQPNLQNLPRVLVGHSVKEILENDLKVECEAIPVLRSNIQLAEKIHDFVSRELFVSILESEEEHVDWLETQLELLNKVGEANYAQSQMAPTTTK